MKKNKLKTLLLIAIIAISLAPFSVYSQLSGNYTINPVNAASSSNYRNWASAIGDLLSGTRTDGGTSNGTGVNGAVVFSVYDTTYLNTSLTITAIPGASSSNTVTFKSSKGDSSKCRLVYASGTSTTDDWVMYLNGADFVTFSKIGFERTGTATNGTVIQFGTDANRNQFLNCLMKGQKGPSSLAKGFQTGIGSCVFFNSSSSDSNIFSHNRFLYGYNGVYNATTTTGNEFLYNVCDTPGSAGIYCSSQTGLKVIGNTFNMGDFGAGKGHYTCYALRIDSSPKFTVANNKANVTAVNSQVCRSFVFSSNIGSATAPIMVYNNSISNNGGTGNCNGIAINGCYYMNFFHNNILVNSSLADGAAFFTYISTTNQGINLVNNNFINKGSGYALSAGDANSSGIDSVDYNNLYSSGPYVVLWKSSTGKHATLSAFKSSASKCTNCLSVDPGFYNSGNLHVFNIAINGKALPIARVLTDIDNETRSTSAPDIGADEFTPANRDASASVLDSPTLFCAGKQVVKVKFLNFGSDTIKSTQIGWSVNGVMQTGANWSGSVASGETSPSIGLGSYTFTGNTAYDFKIWTYNPNNAADGLPINDTLKITRFPALSGKYTIGDTTGANYKTFNSAITAMAERGICGPVTFNVYPGTYKEQLGLTALPGMGSTSPVVFQSLYKDSSKVIVTLLAASNSGSNNGVVQLRGANYVTFKGITFERTGSSSATFAQVIHIMNNSHHNTFTNCQLLGLPSTSNTSTINVWSDQSVDNGNVFRNNLIKGGYYNMLLTSGNPAVHETGTMIENNVFEGSYMSPMQISFNDGIVVRGNKFVNSSALNVANTDMILIHCDSNILVNGNVFTDANVGKSIAIQACNAGTSKQGLIANNNFFRSSGTAIGLDSSSNQNLVFNTISFTGATVLNTGISTSGTNSGLSILNNNIVMQGGEVMHITFNKEILVSNNNNLVSKGTSYIYWEGAYSDLSGYSSSTKHDTASWSVNPLFISPTDLHIKNPLLKGAGTPIAGITMDIDGQVRNSIRPDIGSDEFKLSADDASIISLLNPATGTCAANLPIEVVLKNYGENNLKNVSISWTAAGLPQTNYNWTGNLPTNGMDTITLGNYNFINLNPKFVFSTNLPNGNQDGIIINDTLTLNRSLRGLPVANAGPDKTICLGDTLNLGLNTVTGLTYKWLSTGGLTLGTTAKLNIQPVIKSSYILEVTSSFGCIKRDTTTISINSLPVANAGSDKSVCTGDTINIGPGSISGMTYKWMSLSGITLGTSSTLDIAPVSITSDYVLQVTNTAQKCSNKDTIKVTALTLPVADAGVDNGLCQGSSLQIGTTATSGFTYSWISRPSGFVSASANPNVSPNVNTTYYLTVEETATGCLNKDSVMINTKTLPIILITGSLTACVSDTLSYATTGATGDTYDWAVSGGSIIAGQNSNNVSVKWNTSGSHTLKLLETNDVSCSDNDSVIVSISKLPNAEFGISKSCFGDATQFTDSSSDASTYTWNFGDGGNSTSASPSHNYGATGTYTSKLTVKNTAGCVHSLSKQFDITPVPSASFTFAKQPARAIDFTSTSTISSGNITSWKWDFGDATTSTLENPSHQFTSAGSFNVKLCAMSAAGCESCTTQNLAVTGINDIAFDNTLYVTPNPGSGLFTLNTTEQVAKVTITNAMGQVIETIEPSTATVKFDLSSHAPGMYFIQVNVGEVVKTLKVIKQ